MTASDPGQSSLIEEMRGLLLQLLQAGDMHLRAGELEAAEKCYADVEKNADPDQFPDLIARARDGRLTVEARRLLVEGDTLRQAGDLVAAVVLYRQALEKLPGDTTVKRTLADACFALGEQAEVAQKPYEALDYYREALKADPQHASAGTAAERLATSLHPIRKIPWVPIILGCVGLAVVGLIVYLAVRGITSAGIPGPTAAPVTPAPFATRMAEPTATFTPTSTYAPTHTPSPTSTATFTPTPAPTSSPIPSPTETPVVIAPSCAILLTGPNNNPLITATLNRSAVIGQQGSIQVVWTGITTVPGGCPAQEIIQRRYRLVDVGAPFPLPIESRNDVRLQTVASSGDLRLAITLQSPKADSSGVAEFGLEVYSSIEGKDVWQPVPPLRLTLKWQISAVTPSPTASNTPVPTVTPTLPATLTPTPTPTLPAIGLLGPPPDFTASSSATFEWQPGGPIPNDVFYEVVVWREGSDPREAQAAANALKDTRVTVDFAAVPHVSNGAYRWTVILVRTNPYQRLTLPTNGWRIYISKDRTQSGPECPPGGC